MITNERQYRVTKSQLAKMRRSAEAFDLEEAETRVESRKLAMAELEALESEVGVLSAQLSEYEALKSGVVSVLEAHSLDELPSILIRARIARGLTQKELADRLGMKEQQIQRYESEAYASSSFTRLREVSAALNLSISKVAELNPEPVPDSSESSIVDWAKFPIEEMYKRNWLSDFYGSLAAARAVRDELAAVFVQEAMPRRVMALLKHRVRVGSDLDIYSLWAWQCRVLILARQQPTTVTFSRRRITTDWLRKLAQLSSHEDGPRRASSLLAEVGIRLVIEPHLPYTYLDGAAFLAPDGPVIGMTLRHDRLDNFWFVLLHEVVHVWKHMGRGSVDAIFDDIEVTGDAIEIEADEMASKALIPDDIWETAVARYVRTESAIRDLARDLHVGTAVIAGRIRREADNYVILKDLVGAGMVRRLFPEAQFV